MTRLVTLISANNEHIGVPVSSIRQITEYYPGLDEVHVRTKDDVFCRVWWLDDRNKTEWTTVRGNVADLVIAINQA